MPGSDILLTNKYYPSGLTQEQVSSYYQTNAHRIIKEANGRQVLTFIYTALDKYIVKRNDTNGKPFILTTNNFERIVHPRVVSVAVELDPITSYWCLDIDAKEELNERKKQECVQEIIKFLKNMHEVESYQITTSSTSYHMYVYLFRKQHVTSARSYIKRQLLGYFGNVYNIDKKGKSGSKINIDLSPMSKRGSHTLLYALNLNGLKCIDVTDNIDGFNRRTLIVR